MTEAELKRFPRYEFGQAFTTLKCETSAYLPWLEKRLVEMSLCFILIDTVIHHCTAPGLSCLVLLLTKTQGSEEAWGERFRGGDGAGSTLMIT